MVLSYAGLLLLCCCSPFWSDGNPTFSGSTKILIDWFVYITLLYAMHAHEHTDTTITHFRILNCPLLNTHTLIFHLSTSDLHHHLLLTSFPALSMHSFLHYHLHLFKSRITWLHTPTTNTPSSTPKSQGTNTFIKYTHTHTYTHTIHDKTTASSSCFHLLATASLIHDPTMDNYRKSPPLTH